MIKHTDSMLLTSTFATINERLEFRIVIYHLCEISFFDLARPYLVIITYERIVRICIETVLAENVFICCTIPGMNRLQCFVLLRFFQHQLESLSENQRDNLLNTCMTVIVYVERNCAVFIVTE